MQKTKIVRKRTKVSPRRAPQTKRRKKQIIVTSIAVGAAGILGYFGWQYLKKRRSEKAGTDMEAIIQSMDQSIVLQPEPPMVKPRAKISTPYPAALPSQSGDFPLQKGSKGENVRRLQEALMTKYGKQVLPKYGADGDFGSEMVAALKKLRLPSSITESTLNVIAQGTTVNPSTTGKDLYNATVAKDYNKVISLLQKLKSVDDYTKANEAFKQYRVNGVRQTMVNGLLSTFSAEAQKQKVKFEFLRMGLQYDGSKWSLSGFDGLPIVTTIPTAVWINATQSVKVPALMVLGNEVSRKLDYTLFENGGKHFLVQTKTVKYL